MSKQDKTETIIVEKEDDNVEIDDDSSDEQTWAEVSASASKQVGNIVQTPPNELETRGRQTVPARGGRGGFRGRGRGRGAPANVGGRVQESLQTVIDSQNKIIAKLNSTVEEQARTIEKFRVNYAALQQNFFDVQQERDNLQTEKETRALQKQARLTQKTREVQKVPVEKK